MLYPDVVSIEDWPKQSLIINYIGRNDPGIEGHESVLVDITEEIRNGII